MSTAKLITGPIKSRVANRGVPSDAFLSELIDWGRTAPEDVFAPNSYSDIYAKIRPELGPWANPLHRRAAMLEVLRVLAGVRILVGLDRRRGHIAAWRRYRGEQRGGAWQVSYDGRRLSPYLPPLLAVKGITNGIQFQQAMKFDHPLAMEFVARLMRRNTKHNGPLYKGDERLAIRKSLRGPEHSIYPWLSREAVAQFMALLS